MKSYESTRVWLSTGRTSSRLLTIAVEVPDSQKMAAFPVSWRGKSCHFYCKVIPNTLTSKLFFIYCGNFSLVSKYKMQQKQYITSSMIFKQVKQVHWTVTCFSLSPMATWVSNSETLPWDTISWNSFFRIRTVHSFSLFGLCETGANLAQHVDRNERYEDCLCSVIRQDRDITLIPTRY